MSIKCSAVMFTEQGEIFPMMITGRYHTDCYETMDFFGIDPSSLGSLTEGFLTDGNVFLDRYVAKYEAIRCNQVPETLEKAALQSTDIWPIDSGKEV